MSEFELYPEERHWWSFCDHRAVMSVMRRLTPKRVLEFGPGSSTLALIEGGATHIDTCEDQAHWAEIYRIRLEQRFPDIVRLRTYVWREPVTVDGVDDQRYDLALIDGPQQLQRQAVIDYCLRRCTWVLFPTDELQGSMALRIAAAEFAATYARPLEIMQTGPLSGAFALIGPA